MSLVALLLLNGAGLLLAEGRARRNGRWTWVSVASALSLALWLSILYAGVWLTVSA